MTKKLSTLLVTISLLFVVFTPVVAQEPTDNDGLGDVVPQPALETLEQRQQDRKERLVSALTKKEAEKLSNRCRAAQKVIENISSRFDSVYNARKSTYDRLTAKLQGLSSRLSNQDIDTSALDATITETQYLIDDFVALMDKHKTALADSQELECQDDPSGFKVIIADTRVQRDELKAASITIRDYVKNDVKMELQNIKALLQAASAESSLETNDDAPAASSLEEM